MKKPKKPTIKQMRKRPTLWWFEDGNWVRIAYPNGTMEFFDCPWWYGVKFSKAFEYLRRYHEFLGYL